MSEFLFRLPFAFLGSWIGREHGGMRAMIAGSFIGCIVGEVLMALLVR